MTRAMVQWGPFDVLDDLSPEELRLRLHTLRAIIERAPIPIAIAHDRECRFISANPALASLLGVPYDSNVSLTPPPGVQPAYRIQQQGHDVPPHELPMQYAIAHRTSMTNEFEIVRADGSVAYVKDAVEPLYDKQGNIYGCVSVCVDLTDRRRAEIALREADRHKDEFLATLSHELRNPLAPIRTAVEVMRLARDNPGVIDHALAILERQLHHLVRITDDLLDVSRITQNKIELRRRRVDLRTIMQGAVEATRPLIDGRSQSLSVELPGGPLWADADATRLGQAFANLLNNAAKYTEIGGRISFHGRALDHTAEFTVEDTGIGIPADMLPRIFAMFTQLQPHHDRTLGGLGIGLSLAKRLVELHHGTLEASSGGPGRGSRFTVRVPMSEPPSEESRPQPAETRMRSHCRVLIAEDNADAAAMMEMMLQIKGHDVRVARDGAEAVAIAEAFQPQVAFLDIGMPLVDGYEAARRIRSFMGTRVVLVALTGWGQEEDKRQSRAAGFDHHLTKPPEPEVVEQLIDNCAGQL
jgi:PAS domain S-box-containing protein